MTVVDSVLWLSLLGAVIGIVLAFTGAGGGILSVPLLVFGLHLSVQEAAPIGMVAVFAAALLGTVLAWREALVRYRAAALMGAAGMVTAPVGVLLAQHVPHAPLMLAFSGVLFYSAWRSLANPASALDKALCVVSPQDHRLVWTRPCAQMLASTGVVAGILSGLLGVGGGFVIVPALSRYTNLAVRSVHATSLAVMTLVSFSGALSAAAHGSMRWGLALPFATGAILALLVGRRFASKVHPTRLHHAFAWFCGVVAVLMLARTLGLMRA